MRVAFIGLEGIIVNNSDILIEGADKNLRAILKQWKPYHCFILTSRSESMRETTFGWLVDAFYVSSQYLPDPFWSREHILMKPSAFQNISTAAWKSGIVQTITILDGDDDVLVIDKEADLLKQLIENTEWRPFKIEVYNSLIAARQARFEHGEKG